MYGWSVTIAGNQRVIDVLDVLQHAGITKGIGDRFYAIAL